MNPIFPINNSGYNPINNLINETFGIKGQATSYASRIEFLQQAIDRNEKAKIGLINNSIGRQLYLKYSDVSLSRASYQKDVDALRSSFDIKSVSDKVLASYEERYGIVNLFGKTRIPANTFQSNNVPKNLSGYLDRFPAQSTDIAFRHSRTNLAESAYLIQTLRNNDTITRPLLTRLESNLYSYRNKYQAMYSALMPNHGPITADALFSDKLVVEGDRILGFKEAQEVRKQLYAKSPFAKGILRPEIGIHASNQLMLFPENFAGMYAEKDTYSRSIAYLNQIVGTAGRFIPPEIRGDYKTSAQHFASLVDARNQYISNLTSDLKKIGMFNTYMFSKPEFLTGDKTNIITANPAYYSAIYGTRFEEGPATKGLYQAANLARTTADQIASIVAGRMSPTAAYTIGPEKDMFRQLNMRVGVIDFVSEFYERTLLGDSGSILTKKGGQKLAGVRSFASFSIKNKNKETIAAIEKAFGVNLGADITHSLGAAMTGDVSDLRKISKEFEGLEPIIRREGALLERVAFTDSGMTISFRQATDKLPDAAELVIGQRRTTARSALGNLKDDSGFPVNRLVRELANDVDILMPASEFYKMHGPEVFLNNFVSAIQEEKNADKLFKEIFGIEGQTYKAVGVKEKIIPHLSDLDSAYDAAVAWLRSSKTLNDEQKINLLTKINNGLNITSESIKDKGLFAKLGIKGISVFNIGGGLRLDFGGDINITKPLRYTMSQLQIIASGSRMMGYGNPYMDPVVRILLGRSTKSGQWKYKTTKSGARVPLNTSIGFSKSGMITGGRGHISRRFADAALGIGTVPENKLLTFERILDQGNNTIKYKFSFNGTVLKDIPREIPYGSGLTKKDLAQTFLGLKDEIVYLKLHKPMAYQGKEISAVPLPLKYLALKERDGSIAITKGSSLDKLLSYFTEDAKDDNILAFYLDTVTKEISGKEGRLNRYSTILTHSGSRVRLAPGTSEYHNLLNYTDPQRFFDIKMSTEHFEDLLQAKSGLMDKDQLKFYRDALKNNTRVFHGLLSVDPMQRREHAQVVRIILDNNMKRKGFFGHFFIEAHTSLLKMMERDLDRDVAKLLLIDNALDNTGNLIGEKEINKILLNQQKLAEPYLLFERYRLSKGGAEQAGSRFANMFSKAFASLEQTIGTYIPLPKSLGYTLARGPQEIMQVLVNEGVSGARKYGILGSNINEETIENLVRSFKGPGGKVRFSIGSQFLQSILQSTVQKAGSKEGILNASEEILKRLDAFGRDIPGTQGLEKFTEEVSDILYENIVKTQGSKQRMFLGTKNLLEDEVLLNRFGVTKETTQAVLEDLKGASHEMLHGIGPNALSAEKRANIEAVEMALQKSMAYRMAEVLAPGLVASRFTSKSFKHFLSVARGQAVTDETVVSGALKPLANRSVLDDIASKVASAKTVAEGGSPLSKMASSLEKAFLNKPGFGVGLVVGGVAGIGLSAMMDEGDSYPQYAQMQSAPMPRNIDTRQPQDVGPVIPAPRPRIYGTSQVFTASRTKAPQIIRSPSEYSANMSNTGYLSVSDKTAPNNPHLLQMHLRNLARSDYTY